MSIAIGVVCSNGLVLGTDLEYTGSYEKFPGPKLWQLCPERQRSIILTGAGNPTSIDHVKRIAEQEIRKTNSDDLGDIVFAVEAGLRSLYSLHIDPVPSKEEKEALDVWIMLAVPDGFRFRLFYNDRTVLGEVQKFNCSGMGLFVGYSMLNLLLPQYCSVDLASEIVSYILALSKEWTVNVGKGSNVHMLYEGGGWDSLIVPERKDAEAAYIDLLKELPELLHCCESWLPDPEHFIDRRLADVKAKLLRIRGLQRQRAEDRERRANYLRELQDRQSTKADSPLPPPSPESPGGNGES